MVTEVPMRRNGDKQHSDQINSEPSPPKKILRKLSPHPFPQERNFNSSPTHSKSAFYIEL